MRIWIVDDAGYPSGFAGGRFSAEHPELRMQALLPGGRWPLAQGEALDVAAPDGLVVATATDAAASRVTCRWKTGGCAGRRPQARGP